MSKKNDPNYKQGNHFTEEELNPNRPHDYRKTHNGKSPIGNIQEILKEKKANDPEGYNEMIQRRTANSAKTQSMKFKTKEILNTTIRLTPEEKVLFLDKLQEKDEITVQEAIIYAQITKAVKGFDTAAAAFIRDTSGQKPKDEVEVKGITIDALLKNNGIFDPEEDDLDED
jgi:hypothetical protein